LSSAEATEAVPSVAAKADPSAREMSDFLLGILFIVNSPEWLLNLKEVSRKAYACQLLKPIKDFYLHGLYGSIGTGNRESGTISLYNCLTYCAKSWRF
jgi:hypothetical protein